MATDTPTPLEFLKNMWSNMGFNLPGMITPTFNTEELDKRISELKTVEGWLSMNLSMLQMTIQNLEMQRATLSVVRAMGQMAEQPTTDGTATTNPDKVNDPALLWPWNLMQQMQQGQQPTPEVKKAPENPPPPSKSRKHKSE